MTKHTFNVNESKAFHHYQCILSRTIYSFVENSSTEERRWANLKQIERQLLANETVNADQCKYV